MFRTSALLFLVGCGPVKVVSTEGDTAEESAPSESGPQGETGNTIETGPEEETGEHSGDLDDTGEEPESPWSDGVCQITLTCDGAISDESKTRCDLMVVDANGLVAYDGNAGIELRGRSSMDFPKHQYGVELWEGRDESIEADLLGMGKESDWVFNGAWVDRALFRNKMSYDLFQEIGDTLSDHDDYGPESRFCEMTLDGEYWGVYLLAERPKRDGSRIEIANTGEVDGSSFVLKLDEDGGFAPNPLGYGTWTAIYPRQEDATDEALAGISATLVQWYQATAGGEGAPALFEVLDLDSAVDFVIIEELAKNNDAYFLSIHVWKDEGGLIHLTPWDLDLAYGQPSYNDNENPESWISYRPTLIAALGEDPDFQARLVERWEELRAGPLATEVLHDQVHVYQETLVDAAPRNFERWPIEEVDFYGYLYPVGSWDEELDNIHDWLDARLTWMDNNIGSW